jgi:hypothetical protein
MPRSQTGSMGRPGAERQGFLNLAKAGSAASGYFSSLLPAARGRLFQTKRKRQHCGWRPPKGELTTQPSPDRGPDVIQNRVGLEARAI